MKKCSSLNIVIAICAILIVLLCVGAFVYKPHFSDSLSGNNADWGNFGQFFWGLGTMLLTALSVWVLFSVNRSLNEFNENLQTKQQEFEQRLEKDRQDLQIELEERRLKIKQDIWRHDRIESWLKDYYTLLVELTGPELKSDAQWYNILRKLTLLYNALLTESNNLPKDVVEQIEDNKTKIRNIIIHSYANSKADELVVGIVNFELNRKIINTYYMLIAINGVITQEDYNHVYKITTDEEKKVAARPSTSKSNRGKAK